jgi:hypothetical protein
MSTTVKNLATGQQVTYSLPPLEALTTCHEQMVRKNFNWWDYPPPESYPVEDCGQTLALGDLCVLKADTGALTL